MRIAGLLARCTLKLHCRMIVNRTLLAINVRIACSSAGQSALAFVQTTWAVKLVFSLDGPHVQIMDAGYAK